MRNSHWTASKPPPDVDWDLPGSNSVQFDYVFVWMWQMRIESYWMHIGNAVWTHLISLVDWLKIVHFIIKAWNLVHCNNITWEWEVVKPGTGNEEMGNGNEKWETELRNEEMRSSLRKPRADIHFLFLISIFHSVQFTFLFCKKHGKTVQQTLTSACIAWTSQF